MSQLSNTDNSRHGSKKLGGRPRKFAEASRPVTLTLPHSTLSDLQQINPDRSRAIVELTKRARPNAGTKPMVEVVEMAKKTGLVVVGSSKVLRKIPYLRLIEVAPTRYLLALEQGYNFNKLEIDIMDAFEEKQRDKREQELIGQLLHHLKRLRRSQRASTAEILFVDLD